MLIQETYEPFLEMMANSGIDTKRGTYETFAPILEIVTKTMGCTKICGLGRPMNPHLEIMTSSGWVRKR